MAEWDRVATGRTVRQRRLIEKAIMRMPDPVARRDLQKAWRDFLIALESDLKRRAR
jgi:hypothetical protein